MPCTPIKIGNSTGLLCSRGQKRKVCYYCSRIHEFLCDFPVKKQKNGKWKTCDKPLCEIHTKKGTSGETDFCREHYGKALAAYNRRALLQT